ncbi:MOSC domain-containing protein [Haloferax denitrificans]|uniref:Mosc domain-containing protein n=1 Tax=Haloferax denitrificans ATCC 35960 TaxID=662478 RepID=M0J3G7_9EURY|nr:MOSC domain-containing protein [Haloferax denitrificans]EMA03687.1 mosc domain-containing protein [Haloferax denitrificans ATCC 35960]
MTSEVRGRVEALYTAPSKAEPMVSHEAVSVAPGGIEGDRYFDGDGFYSATDGCPVTLVDAAVLDDAAREYDLDLACGQHRRNVVVRGVDVADLLDATFELGGAELRGTKLRPPCAHLADLVGDDDVGDALRESRGGICADVLAPGRVAVGDDLRVTEANPRELGRQIARRLGGERVADDDDAATSHEEPHGSGHE